MRKTCPQCAGTGEVIRSQFVTTPGPECEPCLRCGGSGLVDSGENALPITGELPPHRLTENEKAIERAVKEKEMALRRKRR